jgi:two-component system sensor histidine kinase MprB
MSLRVRVALISASAVAIAIAIAAFVSYNAARRELIAEVDTTLYDRLELIARAGGFEDLIGELPQVSTTPDEQSLFSRPLRGFDAIFFRAVRSDGTIAVASTIDWPIDDNARAVIAGTSDASWRTVPVEDDNLRVLTVAVPGGGLQFARSLLEVDNSLAGLAHVLQLAAIVGVLVAGAVGFLIARGAARPIGELAAAAEYVAETQELAARIDVGRRDEIGRLAESFNSMLAALESSRSQQRRLVHDAGHELRTPLTALRTNTELLGKIEQLPEEEQQRMLADIDDEIKELSRLVGELVELASDAPIPVDEVESVELDDLVEEVAELYRRRTGRIIDVDADETIVAGHSAQLKRAVSNLLDNADKWSPPGAPIEIGVVQGRVTVKDRGPGIEPADRPYVFDRFYRATRDRGTPGSGLGLSIVAKAAQDHGGRVFVGDSPVGAVVGFEIPPVAEGSGE